MTDHQRFAVETLRRLADQIESGQYEEWQIEENCGIARVSFDGWRVEPAPTGHVTVTLKFFNPAARDPRLGPVILPALLDREHPQEGGGE